MAVAGCVAAREEAEELVAGAAGDATLLERWIVQRERGEPLAWITGGMWFCGRRLRVDRGVYVPRLQSEELARRAAALLPAGGAAADLCTGTGAIASHLRDEVPGAAVVGVDRDPAAVACARRNGVAAVLGDLGRPLRGGAFDVVTGVAPYVPTREMAFLPSDVLAYEPAAALDGGHDGLDVVRRVVLAAARLLRRGGWLLLELGGEQERLLAPALERAGFSGGDTWHDADGDLRGVAARRRDRSASHSLLGWGSHGR